MFRCCSDPVQIRSDLGYLFPRMQCVPQCCMYNKPLYFGSLKQSISLKATTLPDPWGEGVHRKHISFYRNMCGIGVRENFKGRGGGKKRRIRRGEKKRSPFPPSPQSNAKPIDHHRPSPEQPFTFSVVAAAAAAVESSQVFASGGSPGDTGPF